MDQSMSMSYSSVDDCMFFAIHINTARCSIANPDTSSGSSSFSELFSSCIFFIIQQVIIIHGSSMFANEAEISMFLEFQTA